MSATTDRQGSQPVSYFTWTGFAMMCLGMFMAILDVQVVATSLPTIQHALNVAQDQMSWVQTAYLIAEIISIPLTGFLTRTLTLRWLFVIAISIFTVASIGCAASGSFSSLIIWRVLQGFSGGPLIPIVFSAVSCFSQPGIRCRPQRSEACWQCWRRPSGRWWADGSP